MPLQATSGAASYDGFGGGVPFTPTYIEDVFSTNLWTTTNTSQVITNNIDMTKGALTWLKSRSYTYNNILQTAAGNSLALAPVLCSDLTSAAFGGNYRLADSTTGFTMGVDMYTGTPGTAVAWTFRKQPKFFDVVTYTGNGVDNRQIAHSLGSTPGCIIVKSTSATNGWCVYHRASGGSSFAQLALNATFGEGLTTSIYPSWVGGPTDTTFTVRNDVNNAYGVNYSTNNTGQTYVAYLFAHNAGGFGLTGTDNVISCGSFTTDAGGAATVTLGYEPQWVMTKNSSGTSAWRMFDTMRGMTVAGQNDALLQAQSTAAEITNSDYCSPTATGFEIAGHDGSATHIYIAIRRGPMKTPTTGTSVFNPVARTGTGTNPTVVTTTNNPDLLMSFPRTASPAAYGMCFWDKLRGISPMLQSATTSAEISTNTTRVLQGWLNTGYQAGADFIEGYLNYSGSDYVNYPITRAPGFFDVVCYTGTGSYPLTVNHNLGVTPELIITKTRGTTDGWYTYAQPITSPNANWYQNYLVLNGTNLSRSDLTSITTAPTSTAITYAAYYSASGVTYVNYLFASCPGVSKVFSFTGNGSSQTINCGFTGGARFVMIKRTDSTGDWYVWDTARGIVANNDPHLSLNSTAAEVTTNDTIDTDSTGFIVNQVSATNVNVNGASYIGLAIA